MSRELDIQAARLLGWTVAYNDERGKYELRNPDGVSVIAIDAEPGDEAAAQTRWIGVPAYSTEIAAAWTLVEHMRDLWTAATEGSTDRPNLPGSFRSFVAPFDDGAFFDVLHRNADRRWPWAFLYVTPEAIVTAFLAAMDAQEECKD